MKRFFPHLLGLGGVVWILFERAQALGLFQDVMRLGPGDFLTYVAVMRIGHMLPGLPPREISVFGFPNGVSAASLPEYFSEPLVFLSLRVFSYISQEPVRSMAWAVWISTATNILGVAAWAYFRKPGQAWAWVVPTALIALNPWIWARSIEHWHLSWVFPMLWAMSLWWDFFFRQRSASPWQWLLAHGLLLASSIYYGFFLVLLVGCWVLYRRLAGLQHWRLLLLPVALAGTGYSVDALWVTYSTGIHARSVQRPDQDYHRYNTRLREVLRGGDGSPWVTIAASRFGKGLARPAKDGEGFPGVFPKLACILFLFWTWRIAPRARNLALSGLVVFLLVGFEEVPWIRFEVLRPLFPFIRSYARVMMPMTLLMVLWWHEALAELPSSSQSPQKQWRIGLGSIGLIALLLVDFGWIASNRPLVEMPACFEGMSSLRGKGPIFYQVAKGSKVPNWCPMREVDVFALSGENILNSPWSGPEEDLEPGKTSCSVWGPRIWKGLMSSTSGIAWWYDGSVEGRRRTVACIEGFAPANYKLGVQIQSTKPVSLVRLVAVAR